MRYWKRVLTLLLVFSMLAGFLIPVTAEDYASISLNESVSVQVSWEEPVFFTFVPSEDGYYSFFSSDNNDDPRGYVYDEDMNELAYSDDDAEDWNFDVQWWGEAGQTYYLEATGTGACTVQVTKLPAAETMELNYECFYGDCLWRNAFYLKAEFGPGHVARENVTFSSSDETIVQIDEYGSVSLLKPGTATVTATSERGLTDTCTVMAREIETIRCGERVEVPEAEEYGLRRFVPEADGWYGFYSENRWISSYGSILDEELNFLDYQENYNSEVQFMAIAYLQAGKTYYLKADWSDDQKSMTVDLQVTELKAPEALYLDNEEITGYPGRTHTIYTYYSPADSIPEAVTWSSSDSSVATVNEEGMVTLVSGGEAVITATSESGLTASVDVEVYTAQQVTCGESIWVTEYENPLYAFIPETDGWYGFYSIGDQGDPAGVILSADQYWVESNYDNGVDNNFMVKAYLLADTFYYLNATWQSHTTGDAYVATVEPLTPATGLQLSAETLSLQIGERCQLNVLTVPMLGIPESIDWSCSDSEVVQWEEQANGVELIGKVPGTATVTVQSESGLTASCTVTVNDVPSIALDEIITLQHSDGVQRFRFTAPKTGWYAFSSMGNQMDTYGEIYAQNGDWLADDYGDSEANNFCALCLLYAGETYFLISGPRYTYAEEAEYQIHITEAAKATGLELDTTSREGYPGESWHVYTQQLPENSIPESITWSSSDPAVAAVNSEGTIYFLTVGTATVTATSESGLTATCQITVKAIPDIQCGDTVVVDADQGRYMFRFVPETTAMYWFYSTGDDVDPWGLISDSNLNDVAADDDGGERFNFSICATLIGGRTYYLQTQEYNGTGSYTVYLQKAVALSGIQLSETAVTGAPGDSFTLTASVVPENATPEELYWSSSDETIVGVNNDGEVYLYAEGTAVITVTSESGVTASCTVTSKYPEGQLLQCDQPVTLTEGEGSFWFRFTPQTTGWYRFFTQGDDMDPYGTVYDQNGSELANADDNAEEYNFSAEADLFAGQTYYLKVKFYDPDGTDPCTLTVEKMPQPTGIELSQTEYAGYEGDRGSLDAYVWPDGAIPEITWSSSNEDVVTVGQYGEFELHSIGSATITATTANGLKATCVISVIAPTTVSVGDTVTLSGVDSKAVFRFIPEEDGWYGFYTTGEFDTYGLVYDADDEYINDDDDGGENLNYQLICELKAGQVYEVHSAFYGDAPGYGTYEFHVDKVRQAQQIIPNNPTLLLCRGSSAYLDYELWPYPHHLESVIWTSSDEDIVVIEEDHYASAKASGTAVLTVTSESGLTASVTVTVVDPPGDASEYGNCGPNLVWYLTGNSLVITGSGEMYDEYDFIGRIRQVYFPEEISSIAGDAFWGDELESITIPANVAKIGRYAFGCSSLREIRFQGSAPVFGEDVFDSVTATAYYPANDPSWTEEVRQNYGGEITWIPEGGSASAGVTLSGSFTTGTEGTVTLELEGNGTSVTTTASGKTGTYCFANVAAGTYTLRVSKENHVTREYTVTVSNTALTQDVKIHLLGDIDGNGKVNIGDVSKLSSHVRGSNPLVDEYQLLCANVNGGKLNTGDTSALYAHIRGSRRLY